MADVSSSVRRVLSLPKGRVAVAALALAAVAPLSACSGGPDLHPGSAAVVDGASISIEQVDALADDVCTLQEPLLAQQGGVLPMALLRGIAVETLVADALLPAFADEAGIELADVRSRVRDEVGARVDGYPAETRDAAAAFLELDETRRTVLLLAGGAQAASPEQAVAAGAERFAAWRAEQDVVVDPRFGTVDLDRQVWDQANGSVSVKAEESDALDQKAAAALPAGQRCGTPAA